MSETTLDVILNPKGTIEGGASITRAVSNVKQSFVEMAAKLYVAQEALNKVWESARRSAEFEETMGRLNRQMGQFGGTSQSMVRQLQQVSSGILDIGSAATIASRGLAIGLNPDQILAFTEAANLLKEVMGGELPQAFDEIANSVISGRSKILGNIGIFIDLERETLKLATSTGRTTEQITKQEKAMIVARAVTEQITNARARLSDGMLSDADRLRQIEARFTNFWLTVGTGAKTAVIETLGWWQKLMDGLDHLRPSQMAAAYLNRVNPQKETYGPPNPGNLGLPPPSVDPPPPLPTDVQAGKIEQVYERRQRMRDADLERQRANFEAAKTLLDADVQAQEHSAEFVVAMKGILAVQELAITRAKLQQDLAAETALNEKLVAIKGKSLQEQLAAEKRHADKVQEINLQLKANLQQQDIQKQLNEATGRQARNDAEKALGERQTHMLDEEYKTQERQRQEAMAGLETYYQGELDMANAQFFSDANIAAKERELLKEQLAFKLRLTREEIEKVLFLRKAGHFNEANEIAGRGDPTLNKKAVEGIVDSGTAKDIKLAERANNDFFAGWRRGLQGYANDRDGAFGLSRDIARQTAGAMQNSFQTFFDGLGRGFVNFKSILTGVLDFVRQIVSQITAQIITMMIINKLAGLAGGAAGGVGTASFGSSTIGELFGQKKFADGGSFVVGGSGGTDSQRISFMATPGERVSVQTPQQQGAGGAVNIGITVNAGGGRNEEGAGKQGNMTKLARDLSALVELKIIEEQRPGGLLAGGRA